MSCENRRVGYVQSVQWPRRTISVTCLNSGLVDLLFCFNSTSSMHDTEPQSTHIKCGCESCSWADSLIISNRQTLSPSADRRSTFLATKSVKFRKTVALSISRFCSSSETSAWVRGDSEPWSTLSVAILAGVALSPADRIFSRAHSWLFTFWFIASPIAEGSLQNNLQRSKTVLWS